MFAWNCVEAGGKHLGTCIDRFYFGSCCRLPENNHNLDNPEVSDNEISEIIGLVQSTSTAAPSTTLKSTTTTIVSDIDEALK